jgi:sterol desaturase/sphingolipid hydroxylase (fatty acid hydroxylase superfamily)
MIALSLILILPLYKTISDFLFACITMSIFVFLYWFFYKKYKRIFSYDNIKNSLSYNKPGNAILVTIFIFFFLVVCAFMFLGLFLLLIGLLAARDTW